MTSPLSNKVLALFARKKSAAAKKPNRSRLTFDALEDRMLMDHALGALLDHDHCGHEHTEAHPFYAADYTGAMHEDFVTTDQRWNNPTITYSYSNLFDGGMNGLTADQLKSAVEEALSLWAAYAPLDFVEVEDYGPYPSDNEYAMDGYPTLRFGHHFIDGNGSVLAHGYFPNNSGLAGDTHFDSGDSWTVGMFLEVAIHEIGHTLGLNHETQVDAIMNPSVENRFSALGQGYLLQDDVNGIQYLYGAGTGSVTPLTEQQQGIGTPSLIGPSGSTTDTQPTFEWSDAANATWYYLYLYHHNTDSVSTVWVQGQTWYTPDSALPTGDYTFWVLGWGDGEYGEWSEGMDFSIEAAQPATAVLIGPNTTTNNTTPTFRWYEADNASWYYLYVYNNDTGRVAFTRWVQGATSYTLTTPLASGSYTFWVQTWGNGQYGEWSEGMDFEVELVKPGIATLYGPTGSISNSTPTFQWSSVANATWYYLYVYNNDTGKVVCTTWVQGQTGYKHSTALAKGNYTFWVLAWGNNQYGDWSEGMNFRIV